MLLTQRYWYSIPYPSSVWYLVSASKLAANTTGLKVEAMMMSSAEDDDDFIVQTVVETGASDTQDDGAFGWTGLKKMFAKGDNASLDQADAAEPEPTLPPGFSAILNAEEEDIYPAEVSG